MTEGKAGMVLGWHWPWGSVKDRLPDEAKLYLTAFHDMYIELATFNIDREWVVANGDIIAVTHWMPLPEPPEPKEAETS